MADQYTTQRVNVILRDSIVALGAVPVVTDLFRDDAYPALLDQLQTITNHKLATGAAIPDPVGGGVIDVECRAAVVSILTLLRARNIILP